MTINNPLSIILAELDWLQLVINQATNSYFHDDGHENNWLESPVPDLSDSDTPYARFVQESNLNLFERLTLALTMAPHIKPEILDVFLAKNALYDRRFTEFGGILDKNHSGFLPTAQTLCFLASATNPELRNEVTDILNKDNMLFKKQVVVLSETEEYLPRFNGILSMPNRWMHYFTTGEQMQIERSASFPAQIVTTNLEWEDLVLSDLVMDQLLEIQTWLKYESTLLNEWSLYKKIKPGYKALFYGPRGTGKTMTATVLGKMTGMDVYKINLSLLDWEYIGQTEKNLSEIFDTARHKNWILFFDEADALFGKRTTAHESNERHANQQKSYMLQRIEDFPGVVIMASNHNVNIDDAFSRRFQSLIHFDMPNKEERLKLWQNAFSGPCVLDAKIDIEQIAEAYEIAGGTIINVLRSCALMAIRRNDFVVPLGDLMTALKRELKKENKIIIA